MATMVATIQNETVAGRPMQAMTETQSPTTIASFQLSGARDLPSGAREVNTGGDVCTPDEVIGTFLLEASEKRRASCHSRASAQALTGYLIRPASFSRFSWNLATLSNVILASCLPVMARSYWSCCWVSNSKNCGTCHMSFCQSSEGAQVLFQGRYVTYFGSEYTDLMAD